MTATARGRVAQGVGTRTPDTVRALVRLGRVKFLLQSTSVVGAGTAVAVATTGRFELRWYLLVLLFAWLGHLMTHYCNEYFDLDADRANTSHTSWTGGSRVLVEGLLPPRASLSMSFVLLFAALCAAMTLPSTGQRLMAVAIIAVSWFYTAPPLQLNYHALGEVSCATVLYVLVPALAFMVQAAPVTSGLLTYLGVVFALQLLRCLIMNLPDIRSDREVGKTTLAGVLGPVNVTRVYAGGHAVIYTGLTAAIITGAIAPVPGGALLATLVIPWWVTRRLRAGAIASRRGGELLTFWSSMVLPATSCAVIFGMTVPEVLRQHFPMPWLVVASATIMLFGAWLARAVTSSVVRSRRITSKVTAK